MTQRNILIVGVAVFLGLIAVYLVNAFFSGVETKQAKLAEESRMARIVVASQDMAFGAPLSVQNVRLTNWPANSVPVGAFTTIEEATKARVALRPIVPGEPVLASKVSGVNGRATLSANLPLGQVAVSIPINDVAGVSGFIRPGDVVDVLLTRKIPGDGAKDYDKMVDVILEKVPVLGIDQVSDENKTEPALGKTATVQVDTYGAQKLALALQVGTMSLALRNVADVPQGFHQTVTRRDITHSNIFVSPERARSSFAEAGTSASPMRAVLGTLSAPPGLAPRPMGPSMTIVRGTKASQEELLRGF